MPSAMPPDRMADEIAKRISSLVPPAQRAQVTAQVVSVVREENFSGPVPHPKHIREYEIAVPGSGDRLIAMAESEQSHIQRCQAEALAGDIADTREGRRLGFAALALLIIGAILCGVMNKDAIAYALLGAGALGTIGTIIKGRQKSETD